MSTTSFKELIHSLSPQPAASKTKHKDIVNVTREMMRSSLFREFPGLHAMSAEDTREAMNSKDITEYPYGIFSYDHVHADNVRRYIFILMLDDKSHLYIKLMLDDIDFCLSYYRLALVTIDGNKTTHYNLAKDSFEDILKHLTDNGVFL